MTQTRHRLSVDMPLAPGVTITLEGNPAHYLATVLRLGVGAEVAVFNRTQGEWRARLSDIGKKRVTLTVADQLRAPAPPLGLTVCFAPIKGGRMETIIEKATELGASILQPVITARTIVDKVNLDRATAIAREAAEQCERTDWPEIREPVKLAKLLGEWPADLPLIYGDESGGSPSFTLSFREREGPVEDGRVRESSPTAGAHPSPQPSPERRGSNNRWAILAGPEGGFTPEEFALLRRLPTAHGVSLGPRILRADTAIITLCALTLAAWGDWDARPRFSSEE